MLIIKIGDEVQTFNLETAKWVGSDEVLSATLNSMLPRDFGSPQLVFSELGEEGTVLERVKIGWPNLRVIVFEPEPPPDEPGVIY